jgi:hypothetical protein
MKNYPTKSLVLGYQIGLNNDHVYVAIPAKYFSSGAVNVVCQGESKLVTEDMKEMETTLKDKYKKGQNYKLLYFKWEN